MFGFDGGTYPARHRETRVKRWMTMMAMAAVEDSLMPHPTSKAKKRRRRTAAVTTSIAGMTWWCMVVVEGGGGCQYHNMRRGKGSLHTMSPHNLPR